MSTDAICDAAYCQDGDNGSRCRAIIIAFFGAGYPEIGLAREQEQSNRYADRQHTYAAIDLGTNNCRLLVARPTRSGFRVIDAFSRIVRLGEGVSGSGCLSVAAMDRTIEALKICADKMRRRAVDRSRCVATDACRRAQNGAEFLERVSIETGLKLETITAEEEAGLALKGCLPLIQPDARHALVFDKGYASHWEFLAQAYTAKRNLFFNTTDGLYFL